MTGDARRGATPADKAARKSLLARDFVAKALTWARAKSRGGRAR